MSGRRQWYAGWIELHGFTISHLTDQNNLGRLPQRSPHTAGKGDKVVTQLALVESSFLVRVHIFYGVFQGDNMDRPVFIHPVEQGCK